jgi:hypothetical protein
MGEGSDLNVADRRRPWRESDRVVGASRPVMPAEQRTLACATSWSSFAAYVVEDASLGSHFGRAADSLSGERTVAPL